MNTAKDFDKVVSKLPFFEQVKGILEETQDGKKLKDGDVYSQTILDLLEENTIDGRINVPEMSDNLAYAIDQLKKAKKALDECFPIIVPL